MNSDFHHFFPAESRCTEIVLPSDDEMNTIKEKMKECLENEGHAHLSKILLLFFPNGQNGGYITAISELYSIFLKILLHEISLRTSY